MTALRKLSSALMLAALGTVPSACGAGVVAGIFAGSENDSTPPPVQPVPPEAAAGMPIRPVEFDGMTVTPYLNENGGRTRVAYSLRATGMRSPSAGGAKPSPRSGSEAA